MTETPVPKSAKWTISAFFGTLVLLVYLSRTSFIPIQGYLKDVLHLSPPAQSDALLLIAVPTFVAFLFGLARDRWRPFGLPDRGILLIVCPLIIAVNVALAFLPLTYGYLVGGVFLTTVGYGFALAVVQGRMADVAKRTGTSGLMATVTQTLVATAAVIAALAGAALSDPVPHIWVFLTIAGLALLLLVLGVQRPRHTDAEVQITPKVDWQKLASQRTLWVALGIWFLWSFAPAQQTPLLNFAKDVLHISTKDYGDIVAVQQFSFFPTLILYAFLIRRMSLTQLLWLGTAIGLLQWLPVMFVHTQAGAMIWAGVWVGATGGLATGAFFDLIIRACPSEFTGMGLTMAAALAEIATRVGDRLGSSIYASNGFTACALATTGVYALIFLLLIPIPKSISGPKEGTVTT